MIKTTKDEALKLALKSLEGLADYRYTERVKQALAAIREALAEPSEALAEQPYKGIADHIYQSTNGFVRIDPVTGDLGIGTPSKQPAPAPEVREQQEPVEYWTVADGWVSEQAEIPAVAWIYPEFWDHCKMVGCGTAYRLPGDGRQPLYTSPQPSKPWVHATTWRGLTDDEIALICAECSLRTPCDIYYARAIEAKLREKNEHREKNA